MHFTAQNTHSSGALCAPIKMHQVQITCWFTVWARGPGVWCPPLCPELELGLISLASPTLWANPFSEARGGEEEEDRGKGLKKCFTYKSVRAPAQCLGRTWLRWSGLISKAAVLFLWEKHYNRRVFVFESFQCVCRSSWRPGFSVKCNVMYEM